MSRAHACVRAFVVRDAPSVRVRVVVFNRRRERRLGPVVCIVQKKSTGTCECVCTIHGKTVAYTEWKILFF